MRIRDKTLVLAATACATLLGAAPPAIGQWETLRVAEHVERDVPFVPTPEPVVAEMLRLASLDKTDVLYDLGSGDGRLVIGAAKNYGVRAVGVDIDPERIRESEANARREGVTDRVRFIQGDLFKVDLSEATALTLYLLESVNLKLRPKLLRELKPGTPVVSHAFSMGEWEPDRTVDVDGATVYLWTVPADVAGAWGADLKGPNGGTTPITLHLEQEFQRFSGTADINGVSVPVESGKLDGERVAFSITQQVDGRPVTRRFTGRVEGETIVGTATDGRNGQQNWTARRSKAVAASQD